MSHDHARIGSGRCWAVGMLALIVGVLFAPSADAQRVNPLAGLDRDQQRIFQAYTRLFCRQFFKFGENRYVILPNHMRNRENSSGRSFDQAQEEMTETRLVKVGFGTVEKKFPPPHGEVVASALVLPAMDVGHYGFVNSVRISEIVGPEEMIVTRVVLIPESEVGREKNDLRKALVKRQRAYESQSYRVLGFKTDDLREGQTYAGPEGKGLHIAVISTDPTHAFVCVHFDKLKRIRTSEFPDTLRYVRLEPLVFLDLVRDNRERLGAQADTQSLIAIYRRFYNRYVPSRVTTGPAVRPPTPKPDKPDPVTPEPEQQPDPKPDKPDPVKPEPDLPPDSKPDKPEPVEEEEEDDWDYEEGTDTSPKEPGFFGIPF